MAAVACVNFETSQGDAQSANDSAKYNNVTFSRQTKSSGHLWATSVDRQGNMGEDSPTGLFVILSLSLSFAFLLYFHSPLSPSPEEERLRATRMAQWR